MPYPEHLIAPMRAELSQRGVKETRTAQEVDQVLDQSGTVLMVINSVCGCAAGKARPGVLESLQHAVKPDTVATVFAGGDVEATDRVRQKLSQYPPSSPAFALFRDGQPVYMMHRYEIENRGAAQIAQSLKEAYEQYCVKQER